jgi:hypothetical protein
MDIIKDVYYNAQKSFKKTFKFKYGVIWYGMNKHDMGSFYRYLTILKNYKIRKMWLVCQNI